MPSMFHLSSVNGTDTLRSKMVDKRAQGGRVLDPVDASVKVVMNMLKEKHAQSKEAKEKSFLPCK